MTGNNGRSALKIGVMKVRATDGGGMDFNHNLTGLGNWFRYIPHFKCISTGPHNRFHAWGSRAEGVEIVKCCSQRNAASGFQAIEPDEFVIRMACLSIKAAQNSRNSSPRNQTARIRDGTMTRNSYFPTRQIPPSLL